MSLFLRFKAQAHFRCSSAGALKWQKISLCSTVYIFYVPVERISHSLQSVDDLCSGTVEHPPVWNWKQWLRFRASIALRLHRNCKSPSYKSICLINKCERNENGHFSFLRVFFFFFAYLHSNVRVGTVRDLFLMHPLAVCTPAAQRLTLNRFIIAVYSKAL